MKRSDSRVGVFVDGANIDFCGHNYTVDWRKFKMWAADGRELTEAHYINSTALAPETVAYYKKIKEAGFEMWRQQPIFIKNAQVLKQCGIDVLLAIKAMEKINNFDVFTLISGDCDFIPLLEYMLEAGKDVEVISNFNRLNPSLKKYPYSYVENFLNQNGIEVTKLREDK
jgi:uncharacterized LabA/DUF88 family protein